MKNRIIALISVVALIVMTLPAVSPPPVSAGKVSVDFTQYANKNDEWIGSILQKNNSIYYECMSVPQRTILDDIASTTGGAHTFTFNHMATKGGIHAYDWLTAYNQGNDPPLPFDACGEKISSDFATICESLHTSGYSILVDVPDDPFVSKDGSTQTRIAAYEAQFENRQIKIYGDQPFAAAGMTLSHTVSSGGDTGDSYIEYVLSWTSNSTQILIEMAGHLAASGDPAVNPVAWGLGLGASQVSGGPYHFKMAALDGDPSGAQDNQIMGADILQLPGTIVAHKFNDLNDNGSQDSGEGDLEGWTMTLYAGSDCSTGDLEASGTTGSDGNVVFDNLEAGDYYVVETLEPGWTNSTALCQQVTIGAGESATRYFGNFELKPDIDVEKTASPTSGAASTNVTFTITVENTGELTLDPVKVVDTVPAGMSYVSTGTSPLPDSSTKNLDGTWTITWDDIGSMAPGNITTIYLVAHIDGDILGTLTNSVTATGTPTYGDDVEDTDTADVKVYHAGIDVEKTADPGCGAASANITFTITVTNTNGSVLDPVIVVDTLPDGMSYVSDDAGGTESPAGTITWDIGLIASGNATTIHLVARIDGDVLGTLTNIVTATGTPPEGDNVEDSDTADVLAIDARISISPPEDINVVGDEHILTAKVEVDDGTGWEPYEGATVTFEVTDGPGTLEPVTDDTDASGEAVTTLTSSEAGNSTIEASTSVCGYDISTDGEVNNNKPAEKEWVYARISIDPPHDINVVDDLHELTATVETSTNNITWNPYEGATVTFNVTSGPGTLDPVTDDTDASGEAETTLTSTQAGNSTVTASTKVYDFDLSTDGEAYNSDPAEKEWVYARIKIDPPHDINVVGDLHELTATVETSTNGTDWDPYPGANVTFDKTEGPGTLNPVTDVTDADGEAETTLTSTVTGTSIVKASTTVYDWALSTDGEVYNSDPAEKDWVYARIKIDPPHDINVVGDLHELTATVETSTNNITWNPYEGATVTFNVTSGPGTLDPVTDDTDASGEAKTTLTSTEAGNSTVTASTSICGYDLSTNGTANNSKPAEKEWVYARIKIDPPEDINVVDDSHNFTATVETSTNNITWDPYEGATVTFNVTSGPGTLNPINATTNIDGEAKTTLTSTEAGNSTVTASTTVYDFDLSTDGEAYNSKPAEKDWVYARIKIDPPEDTNIVGDSHNFTATVETSTNNITWNPYEGATVTFNVTSGPGDLTPPSAVTDASGEAETTLTSTEAGNSTVTASTKVYDWDLSTDGEAYNSDPAEKEWVYARISIDPPHDINVVGDLHELTATVETSTNNITWNPYEGATVTFNVTSGPGTLDPVTDDTDASGQAVTTLTSTEAGNSTVTASTKVYDFDLSTDGEGYNSKPAEKEWVYARIKIDPPHDINVVGDSHNLTATVETSTNNITWDSYEGATVTFEVTSGPGTLNPINATTNIDGEAKTTLTSTATGTSIVKASTTVYDWALSTDGKVNNSKPAEKEWVYARIKIDPPEDINVVGDSHNFTATVETSTNGKDWNPYEGATVTFNVTSGPGDLTPPSAVTNSSGQAVTTLISTETGTTTVKASTTVYDWDLSTDGEAYNSDPAEKEWVDARISISPDGINPVGQSHDFTVTVEKYLGEDTGWIPAAGVNVTPTHSGVGSITSSGPYVTDSSGQVTVTVNSAVAGTAIVHASATVSIDDVDIDVATDGYGAYDVRNTKRWTTPPTPPAGGCPSLKELTVDWEGNNTTEYLYSNDRLAEDLLGPSSDLIHNLFLERGTHAPVVGARTHYLIVVRALEDIPDLPEDTTAIVVFNITPTGAGFDKDIFLTLGIDELPQNALNVSMAYYDDITGVWVLMDSEAGGPNGVAELTLSAPINHFSIFGVLAATETTPPPQPAHFVPSGLSIEPSVERIWEPVTFVTKTGESVTITANVANDGGQADTYTVLLKLNGETADTKTVTVEPGRSKQVSFTVSGLDYGQYEVEIAGLSGEFTASRTITWWLIILIIVGIGLIIWGVVWGRRRRRARQQA